MYLVRQESRKYGIEHAEYSNTGLKENIFLQTLQREPDDD